MRAEAEVERGRREAAAEETILAAGGEAIEERRERSGTGKEERAVRGTQSQEGERSETVGAH
jgi:hypothetical protein